VARERKLPIAYGYQRGVAALPERWRAARQAKIRIVTAFAFSEENWKRPSGEVRTADGLCIAAASGELRTLAREGVRVRLCGRGDRLPAAARGALAELVAKTAGNDAVTLNLAIDYEGDARSVMPSASWFAK